MRTITARYLTIHPYSRALIILGGGGSTSVFLAGEAFEDRTKAGSRRAKLLGQHARPSDDGHEVGVAVPARHEMHVHVLDDAGAGRRAEIDADVDSFQPVGLAQRGLASLREQAHLVHLAGRELRERGLVPVRHHHQVAVVIGVKVEDDVGELALEDEEILIERGCAGRLAGAQAEDAPLWFGVGHVLQPPRRPKMIHYTTAASPGSVDIAAAAAASAASASRLISSFSSLPGLK